MSEIAIKVTGISKRYRLGLKEIKAKTLVGQVSNLIRSPWENLKRLREMSRFGVEDESVFWALKDINFEVQNGEVLGIIGKNGAGKSTLLKILSQITEPTSGKIEIHGRVASLLEVGTGFHPELTGRENIYMNGTILGMTRREIDSKLDEIIDFSGIGKFIDTPVKFYSSGMKVRLGFSVAAHLEPEILIIDEVLAVGDYEFQQKCIGKMEDVSKNQGRTVLFVSHNMEAIRSLCHRSILLSNGEVISDGPTAKVLEEYLGKGSFKFECTFKIDSNRKGIFYCSLNPDDLANGDLELVVGFSSPNVIDYPVIGMVIYNQVGTPVLGSNPRFHQNNYLPNPSKYGYVSASLNISDLHSGLYSISLWFGDQYQDYDHIVDALFFEYISNTDYVQKPDPLKIGSIDRNVNWLFQSSI